MRKVLPLLAALLLVGCGGSSQAEQAASEPPSPADLAAHAVGALEEAGSAHYVFDVEVTGNAEEDSSDVALHVEGNASSHGATADVSVDLDGVGLRGTVLASRDELLVDFMGQWYGEHGLGLDDRADELPSEADVREYFDDLFAGTVAEGPEIDGVATWRFEGKLDADGFADLTERFEDEDVTAEERALLRLVAEKTRFVLDVGQEDDLPRHLEFRLVLSGEDLAGIGDGLDAIGLGNLLEENVRVSLDLSDFGTPVEYDAPADYRPLDELFDQLFSGL